MSAEAILFQAHALNCHYGSGKKAVHALRDIDFTIARGEVVSLVGESGSGKSTLARMLLGLQAPTSGSLLFDGLPVVGNHAYYRRVQGILQDPIASFNQFYTVRTQLAHVFRLHQNPPDLSEQHLRIDAALQSVGLDPARTADRYPHELSGGQCQRLLLARIVLASPEVLIADEPTTQVDACSRAHLLDLLMGLRHELSMTIVFVTHDLGLAHHLGDRMFIMHQGQIVESADAQEIFQRPSHAYTRQLLESIPRMRSPWIGQGFPNHPFHP